MLLGCYLIIVYIFLKGFFFDFVVFFILFKKGWEGLRVVLFFFVIFIDWLFWIRWCLSDVYFLFVKFCCFFGRIIDIKLFILGWKRCFWVWDFVIIVVLFIWLCIVLILLVWWEGMCVLILLIVKLILFLVSFFIIFIILWYCCKFRVFVLGFVSLLIMDWLFV